MRNILLISIVFLVALCSCRKENIITDDSAKGVLAFSADTIFFDTIFSSLNAPVERISIINTHKKAVKISSISLEKAESELGVDCFRFNINGDTSKIVRDLVLEAGDSVFVFVRSGISPQDQNLPYLVDAYLSCNLNGEVQNVYIQAYGRDANYIKWNKTYTHISSIWEYGIEKLDTQYIRYYEIPDNFEFNSPKAYVITGYLAVPSGRVLNIPAGISMHFAPNSGIWVREGASIRVNGNLQNPVRFTGIRQDENYKTRSGQWGKIWLDTESEDNIFEYAIIENGSTGIWIDSCVNPKASKANVQIENTIIRNMTNYAIVSHRNSLEAINLLAHSCEKVVSLVGGGNYWFTHCTLANYKSKTFAMSYALEIKKGSGAAAFGACNFTNTIFYGNASSQINWELEEDELSVKPYFFDHCFIRQEGIENKAKEETAIFVMCRFNTDPKFVNIEEEDYSLDSLSPARTAANPSAAVGVALYDLRGNLRSGLPTVGAIE